MPSIERDLGANFSDLQWVIDAYALTLAGFVLAAGSLADMGLEVAPGLYEAELRYLVREEWAHTAEDVLWRRSKLGLHFTPAQRQAVQDWFDHPPR